MTDFFRDMAAEVCGYTKNLKAGLCPTCGERADLTALKTAAARREYTISLMCNECQERIFSEE